MAVLFVDGFDKYGPAGQTTPTVASLVVMGEWTGTYGTLGTSIVAPLSSAGQAINVSASTVGGSGYTKTLAANYGRIIGGFRFASPLQQNGGIEFRDGATAQFAITVNGTTGTISIRSGTGWGTSPGSAIATSSASVTANSTHYLEWDVTIGAAGAYQVWLDGVSVLSGTGNTRAGTANAYTNAILLGAGTGNSNITFDDLYLFDSTGATNNAPLLNNPVVETAFPNADSAKAWTNSASIIGVNNSAASPLAPTANVVRVRPHVAQASMTLNSISIVPNVTNNTVQLRPVVYASAATGAALLATGPTVVGSTLGAVLTMPLTAPLALIGGTTYAIGYMSDTIISMNLSDGTNAASSGTASFGSGAPATLPTMSTGSTSVQMWGTCTSASADWPNLAMNPPVDDAAYLSSSTVNQQEMQGFPALASTPSAVACVAYKARIKRSDAGNRNVEVHCASGAADSAGSTAGGVTPGSSYAWIGGYFPLDPQSGVAWTGSGVNGATGGVKVVT